MLTATNVRCLEQTILDDVLLYREKNQYYGYDEFEDEQHLMVECPDSPSYRDSLGDFL